MGDTMASSPQDLGGIAAYNHSCPSVTGADIMRQVGTEAQVTTWSQKRRTTSGCNGDDYSAVDVKPGEGGTGGTAVATADVGDD